MSSGTNTVSKSSRKGSKTASSMKPPCLGTLTTSSSPVHLKNTRALSTYLQQVFLANHSQWQARKEVKTTKGTSGRKRSNVFAIWDPDSDTPCWKTSQVCLILDTSAKSSLRWPKQGSMQDGVCSEQTMWEPRTDAKGSGFWPTPRVSDTEGGIVKNVEMKDGTFSRVNKQGVRWGVKLKDAVDHAEKMWPTPTVQDSPQVTGQLNPTWVEWLMGWPIGWLDLEPMDEMVWLPFDPEPNIPRVTTGEKDRVQKLKALGNGQVPQCLVAAWTILSTGT